MAVFRRGAHLLAVLDEERALDITRLADHPAWSGAELRRVPGGAVLSWPSAGLVPEFRRDGTDWVLSLRPGAEAMAAPLRLQPEGSRAVIAAPPAAQVVTITDPETGLPLLVGTLREPGLRQGITVPWPSSTCWKPSAASPSWHGRTA
jgi:hypothetical protein